MFFILDDSDHYYETLSPNNMMSSMSGCEELETKPETFVTELVATIEDSTRSDNKKIIKENELSEDYDSFSDEEADVDISKVRMVINFYLSNLMMGVVLLVGLIENKLLSRFMHFFFVQANAKCFRVLLFKKRCVIEVEVLLGMLLHLFAIKSVRRQKTTTNNLEFL